MQAGDVIYIEANSGAVKRVGRSDAFATEFDLEAEEYVPLPKVSASDRENVCVYPMCHAVICTLSLSLSLSLSLTARITAWLLQAMHVCNSVVEQGLVMGFMMIVPKAATHPG